MICQGVGAETGGTAMGWEEGAGFAGCLSSLLPVRSSDPSPNTKEAEACVWVLVGPRRAEREGKWAGESRAGPRVLRRLA